MKTKALAILVVLALIITVAGCSTGTAAIVHPSFKVQYIRTNGYHDNVAYPLVSVIRSQSELTAYYDKNKDLYDLERRKGPASDQTIGFLDAIDQYNESFFTKNMLILILLEEGSGSIHHLLKDIYADKSLLNILIERQIPEVGTADMAEWHLIVELKKKDFQDQEIKVYFSVSEK